VAGQMGGLRKARPGCAEVGDNDRSFAPGPSFVDHCRAEIDADDDCSLITEPLVLSSSAALGVDHSQTLETLWNHGSEGRPLHPAVARPTAAGRLASRGKDADADMPRTMARLDMEIYLTWGLLRRREIGLRKWESWSFSVRR
jgi:hypothetical protein